MFDVEAGKSYMVNYSLFADGHRLSKTQIVPDIPVIDAYLLPLRDPPNLDLAGAPARVADYIANNDWSRSYRVRHPHAADAFLDEYERIHSDGTETFGTNYDLYSDPPILTNETVTGAELAKRLEQFGGVIPSTMQFTIKES